MRFSEVSDYDREVVILRVAARVRSRYELGQHIAIAQHSGLSDDVIRSIIALDEIESFSGTNLLLVKMVDEIFDNGAIEDDTWLALASHYENPALVELVMLVGVYRAVGDWLNILNVQLESDMEALVNHWVDE